MAWSEPPHGDGFSVLGALVLCAWVAFFVVMVVKLA